MRFGVVSTGCSGARIVTGACSSVTRSRERCRLERREPALAQAVERVVLRDDRAARLDVGEQRGQALGEIRPHVEGADADDHRVEAAQPFRRQVGAGQRRDLVAHLLQGGGHVVAGARQVADVAAASRQLERHRLQARAGGCRSWSGR